VDDQAERDQAYAIRRDQAMASREDRLAGKKVEVTFAA
jgi:hypothetical protein